MSQSQSHHPETFKLALGAGRVYAVLCALIPVGETRRLSQLRIAKIGCISESTVSRAMPTLEEFGFIHREPAAGGHDITLRQLPEPEPFDEFQEGSPTQEGSTVDVHETCAIDPFLTCTVDPRLESGIPKGSPIDPTSCMDDHVLDLSNNNNDMIAREQDLQIAGVPMPEEIWHQLRAIDSTVTLTQARNDFQKLLARGKKPEDAAGILAWAMRKKQPIYGPEELQTRARTTAAQLEENPYAPKQSASEQSEQPAHTPPATNRESNQRTRGGNNAANRRNAGGAAAGSGGKYNGRQRTNYTPAAQQPPALTKGALAGFPRRGEVSSVRG